MFLFGLASVRAPRVTLGIEAHRRFDHEEWGFWGILVQRATLNPQVRIKMEPESLGVEENRDEAQDLSLTTQPRGVTHVLTLDEISNLAAEEGQPAETLMNVVALIAKRFDSDVCSAYLLEPDRANLVLAATVGLRPECIGNLRMAITEGLAGLVAEQVRPVAVEQAQSHPRFKYFREAGEDSYQSFLGVPLIDRGVLQGVLVVQTA